MKTLVVYKSKTGYTKRYAEWIAEELNSDIENSSDITPDKFNGYDVIIYGGGIYATRINGVNIITKNTDELAGKKVVVFATGMAPSKEEDINKLRDKNFTLKQ